MTRRLTPESSLKATIADGLAARYGLRFYRLNSGATSHVEPNGRVRYVRFSFEGCPDGFVLLPNGRTLWIELKSPEGSLRPAQIIFRDACRLSRIPWVAPRSWEELDAYLRELGVRR